MLKQIKAKMLVIISLAVVCITSFVGYSLTWNYVLAESSINNDKEISVAVDGSEFTLDTAACTAVPGENIISGGSAPENIGNGYDKPAKLYVNGLSRGFATYLDFGREIDTAEFSSITIEWSKNIGNRTTLYFYRNGDNINGTPVDMFTSGEGKYEDKTVDGIVSEPRTTFFVTLSLELFSDPDGKVSGIVIKHETDERESDYEGFAMRIYSIRLGNAIKDYDLQVNGEDFTVSGIGDYPSGQVGLSIETGKYFCNAYTKGKAIKIDLAKPINALVYHTLTIKLSLFLDGFSTNNYYIGVARGDESDISALVPVTCRLIQSTNDKFITAAVELSVPVKNLCVDGENLVSSVILYHYDGDRADDTTALSLFIWGGSVSKNGTENNNTYPAIIDSAAIIRGQDTDTIIFYAEDNIYYKTAQISPDNSTIADILSSNDSAMSSEDIQTIILGYNGDMRSFAIVLKKGFIDYSRDNILVIDDKSFVINQDDESWTYIIKAVSEFTVKSDTPQGILTPVGTTGTLLGVSAETDGDFISYVISFSNVPGQIEEDAVCNHIKINGVQLSEMAYEDIFIRGKDLIIKVKSSELNIGQNEITLLSGFSVEIFELEKDRTFIQYDLRDKFLYSNDEPLTVLWFESTDYNDQSLQFVIKVSGSIASEVNISESAILSKVTINGKPLYGGNAAGVSVIARDDQVTFRIPVSDFELSRDGSDIIVFEQGFALPTLGATMFTKTFRYDVLWLNYEVVPDKTVAEQQGKSVGIVLVETASDTTDEKLSIQIEFTLPVSYRYYVSMQQEPFAIAQNMSTISSSNPTDLFISDLAYYGVLDSCLHNIKYDGKTIYEWFTEIKMPGEAWYDKIAVAYLGNNLYNYLAKRMSITITLDENLISLDDEHTLEFEEGLITPTLNILNSSYSFKWSPSEEKWLGVYEVTDAESTETEGGEKGGGCSSNISSFSAVIAVVCVIVTGISTIRKKRRTR